MNPHVSVVIPAYNNSRYLAQTLDSVLAQTYDDYEVVIAHHSSTNDTAKIIDRYRSSQRLRVLEPTPAGGGAQANWNRVSRAARGELIKLVCGDDLIAPDLLQRQVAVFERYPSLALTATRRNLIDARGKTVIRSRGVPPALVGLHPGSAAMRTSVRQGTNIFGEPGCVMMRRDLLEAIGWWDNTNPYVIDERTYCRVLLEGASRGGGDFFGIDRPLASFRINAGQWSVQLANAQSDQVATFHADLLRDHPDVVSRTDVIVGNVMARMMAYGRRATYFMLGTRRMGVAD